MVRGWWFVAREKRRAKEEAYHLKEVPTNTESGSKEEADLSELGMPA